jgi:hypothetical protein
MLQKKKSQLENRVPAARKPGFPFSVEGKPRGPTLCECQGKAITSCFVRRDIMHPIRERLGAGRFPCLPAWVRNARVVQQQLGHADLRMLQRYAHVVPQDQRNAVERTTEVFLRRSAANASTKPLIIN